MFPCDSCGAVAWPATVHIQPRSPFGGSLAISVPEPVDRSVRRVIKGVKRGTLSSKRFWKEGRDDIDYQEYGHSYVSKGSVGSKHTYCRMYKYAHHKISKTSEERSRNGGRIHQAYLRTSSNLTCVPVVPPQSSVCHSSTGMMTQNAQMYQL